MRISHLALVLLLGLWACSTEKQPETADTPPSAEESDWISLNSLDAWRNFKQDTLSPLWQVEDGSITLTDRGGGDIVTKETFESFVLEMEWKISEGGNSGIFFHVSEADSLGAVYHSGPEMQVLDDERHPDREKPSHRAGANYDLHTCEVVSVKPAGEWNAVRLVVDNGHVEHWLNGEKVVDYTLGSPDWEARYAASKFTQWPAYGRAG
ncbi:MAG: DUF1080 domain-containing protein, partial [Bacteroidetes bacterium]